LKRLTLILFFYFSGAILVLAQLETVRGSVAGFPVENWYELSVDNTSINTLLSLEQPKDQPFQFALPVPVDLNPSNSGFIKKTSRETIWTIGIRSASAKSLNLILSPFNIPDGSYVYVYDSKRTTVRGAFCSDNNNSANTLALMPVPGEELILEYHVPSGKQMDGTLGIKQVSHDYRGILGSLSKDEQFGASQACNVDINCSAGDNWTVEKRAVCRIIVRGIELCTGVLVNNTNHENKAYLITANHCITSSSDAANSVFYFGYESPWCKGPDGYVYHSISGSTLKASNGEIDFSLVELSSFPPFTYHPYLAGWDVSGTIPNKTVAIHHPMGDVKKISVDNNQPVNGTYSADYKSNGFWKILNWDSGTTEGGSSGCPLFDQNKRVVGLLTGGEATCMYPVNDYFAKLSVSYDLSSYLWMQLKGWIDPAVSGVKKYDGRDPYEPNMLTVDTLSNLSAPETRLLTAYTSSGTGYSTGYNSDSIVMYAEHFISPVNRYVSEIQINVAKVNQVALTDSVSIYILQDGTEPGAVIARQKLLFSATKDTFVVKVDFKNTIPVTGNFYIGWRIYYHAQAASENRQFAVFHSPDRGDPLKNTAWFHDGVSWKQYTSHPSYPMSVSLDVKVVTIGDPVPDAVNLVTGDKPEFVLYPNPATDRLVVSSSMPQKDVTFSVYDMRGAIVSRDIPGNVFPGVAGIDLGGLSNGIYYLVIRSVNGREVHKFIIRN